MKMNLRTSFALAAAVAATQLTAASFAGTSANSAGTTQLNGTGNPAVTITLSGSTAMQNFTVSPGISYLTPGGSITLSNGAGGGTTTYSAGTGGAVNYQLASNNFGNADLIAGTTQRHSGIRLEWHAQGSVEGILELTDSQIDDTLQNNVVYDHTSTNPVFINTNNFTGGTFTNGSATLNGFLLQNNGSSSFTARAAGAINPIQMAISDVNARQGFSRSGTGTFSANPNSDGYGKGNPLFRVGTGSFATSGLGQAYTRQQLLDQTALNMLTTKVDPRTGTFNNSGPWNSAGIDNLDNHVVAVTATAMVANPGTGLDKLNRSDAKWLQTTGRLQNGADFNVATRDVNSGTRNVFALNTGVDPSWAGGEFDDGNSTVTADSNAQRSIGSGVRFSGKTGGGLIRDTVQNGRMALGTYALNDAVGRAKTGQTNPLRVLSYRDSTDETAAAVAPSYATVTDGTYVIWQNETYVTVKDNNSSAAAAIAAISDPTARAAAWKAATDDFASGVGIKGDNSGHDVADFRKNILGTVANYTTSTPTSVANPADQLLATNFIPQEFMAKRKADGIDGVGNTEGNPDYVPSYRNAFLSSGIGATLKADAPNSITNGVSSVYGGSGTTNAGTFGNISITAASNANGSTAGGNYLFGNFRQNGIRDFAAVKAALDANKAMELAGVGKAWNAGSLNNTPINTTGVATLSTALSGMTAQNTGSLGANKGDLIVLGDYDSNGTFDGKDLYLLARGASLADNTGTDTLNVGANETFGDALRRGVLRKNAALKYMSDNTTDTQKTEASVNGTLSTSTQIANAFRIEDVNRDGAIDLKDAKIVDSFHKQDYRVLEHQLNAAIGTDGLPDIDPATQTPRPISLVDVELNDTGNINIADFAVVRTAIGSLLVDGDANFDGTVDTVDFAKLVAGFGTTDASWSQGNFDLTGDISSTDFNLLVSHFGQSASGALPGSFLGSPVPEPAGTLAVVLAGGLGLRRRNRRAHA